MWTRRLRNRWLRNVRVSSGGIEHQLSHTTTAEMTMKKCRLVGSALFLFTLLAGSGANAAGGCGAGLYRDHNGRCRFYRAVQPESQACAVGFIWRNGRCRQNVGNDPFVSTWPNAPR
jgi:hypothetical protein